MNKKKVVSAVIVAFALAVGVVGSYASVNGKSSKADDEVSNNQVVKDVDLICYDYELDKADIVITSDTYDYDEFKNKKVFLKYFTGAVECEGTIEMTKKVIANPVGMNKSSQVYFECVLEDGAASDVDYEIYSYEGLNKFSREADIYEIDNAKVKLVEEGKYETTGEDYDKLVEADMIKLTTDDLLPTDINLDVNSALVTYSVNGSDEKVIFARRDCRNIPNTGLVESYWFEAYVFANVGDIVEYTFSIPGANGSVRQSFKGTVVAGQEDDFIW